MNNLLRKSSFGQTPQQFSLRRITIRLKAYRSCSRPLPTIPVGKLSIVTGSNLLGQRMEQLPKNLSQKLNFSRRFSFSDSLR